MVKIVEKTTYCLMLDKPSGFQLSLIKPSQHEATFLEAIAKIKIKISTPSIYIHSIENLIEKLLKQAV